MLFRSTDAGRTLGFDEAISRAKQYYDMGADMIFISAPSNIEEVYKMKELGIPICTAVVEGSSTGNLSIAELGEMGFKIVKYPQTLIRTVIKATTDVLTELKTTGKTIGAQKLMATPEERNRATDLEKFNRLEEYFKTS